MRLCTLLKARCGCLRQICGQGSAVMQKHSSGRAQRARNAATLAVRRWRDVWGLAQAHAQRGGRAGEAVRAQEGSQEGAGSP